MSAGTCELNRCGRPQGSGTWASVVTSGQAHTIPVCEEHWQALRDIFPLPVVEQPS